MTRTRQEENLSAQTRTWNRLFHTIRIPDLPDILVGFNANLDQIIPVTPGLLEKPALRTRSLARLRSRLIRSMQLCTAEEWFVKKPDQFLRYCRAFSSSGNLAVGGQAGIAAEHLAGLRSGRVFCALPLRHPEVSDLLAHAGVIVPDIASVPVPDQEKVHMVFEYDPGVVPPAQGILPRHNRFIVSPIHSADSVLLSESSLEKLQKTAGSCTRGFFSGYQYLTTQRDFAAAGEQLALLKEWNRSMRIHTEWVSVTDEKISRLFARYILPETDSLGMNGQELLTLLSHLGREQAGTPKEGIIGPSRLIDAAITLVMLLGLRRLHVHTHGYYVLVLNGAKNDPEVSRTALLFASRKAAESANGTMVEIPAGGIRAVCAAAEKFPQESPGIFSAGSCTVLVIPTLLARDITKSSGLGDILSSTAFAADRF